MAEKSKLPMDRRGRSLVAWSLLAGVLLWGVLAGPFFAGRIYTADDLGAFHLPIRAFYAQQLAQGQPFDWMPQLFSGFYLTGEGQAGAYHPLHQLLYRVFPLRAALGLEYLLPYPVMMLGTWLFLRRRLGRSDAAMLGGLLFAFSSFNLLHFVHPNAVAIIAHIPWLLWAIDIALTDSRRRHVALATALIALLTGSQLLLGYPQYVWFSLVAEGSYALFTVLTQRYAARIGCDLCATCGECVGCNTPAWPRVVIAKAIGALIGGAQLLPSLDAWQHSARVSVGEDFAFWGSLHPLNLLQLIAPYLFTARIVGDNTHEFGLYAGAVPVMLIVWLLTRRTEMGEFRKMVWAILGFAVVVLLLSFGQYGNIYRVLTWIPLLRSFRFPCRYLVLFQLAIAVLAAIGFLLLSYRCVAAEKQRELQRRHRDQHWWQGLWRECEPVWYLVGISLAIAVCGLRLRNEPYIASVPAILAGPILLTVAAFLVVFASRGYSVALTGLIIFGALDLGYYGLSYSAYRRSDTIDAYVASAHTPPGEPDGRVVASLFRVDQPGLRTGDLMMLRGWWRADGYAGLEPNRQLDYRLLPALRVAGVRWVQRNASTRDVHGLEPCDEHWMEVPNPLPRVRLVSDVRTTNRPARDIAKIRIETTVLSDTMLNLPDSDPGTAALVSEMPGRLMVDVDCPGTQLLVVAESYHEGWQATIDGQPTALYRINGDFMGCLTSAGRHRVSLEFRPVSLTQGRRTSWIGLAVMSAFFVGSFGVLRTRSKKDELV
jgi:hypothetical protein